MKAAAIALVTVWMGGLSIAGCWVAPVDLAGKRCPCPDGWTCDTPRDRCVRSEDLPGAGGSDAGGNGGGSAGDGGGGGGGGGPDATILDASVDARIPPADDGGGGDAMATNGSAADAGDDAGKVELCQGQPAELESSARIYATESATNYRCSPNGQYRFGFDASGDLQLTRGTQVLWSSGTSNKDVERVTMQVDSNLVIRSKNGLAVFGACTNRAGVSGGKLVVRDEGHFEIVSPTGAVLGSSAQPFCPPE